MNQRQWSRQRFSRFTAPKCKAFPRRWAYGGELIGGKLIRVGELDDWYLIADPAAVTRELNAQTPEDAYWETLIYARGSGTPEDPDGMRESSSYRRIDGVRGGSMIVTAVNSAWQQKVINWAGESRVGS